MQLRRLEFLFQNNYWTFLVSLILVNGDAMTAHFLSTCWVVFMAIFGQKFHLMSSPGDPEWLDQGLDLS